MSLATRISAFLLIALALVLAGFSGTLYLLARGYLARQIDDRLGQALDVLEASIDIEPGGLEWEPTDRQLTLGVDRSEEAVRWAVRDPRGRVVDLSPNARGGDFPRRWSPRPPGDLAQPTAFGATPGWRMAGRTLRLDQLLKLGRGHPNDEPGYEVQYQALILIVGVDPAPVGATLGRLVTTLVLLSVGIWIAAAALGRWLGRRALMPIRRMASAAAEMTADDLGRRLPAPGTGDELEVLGRAFNGLLDRLNGAFTQLHEAYNRQRDFARDASHQLRTPLAALLGQVQLALRRDRTPEDYRRVLDLVQVEAIRLRKVVESLLALAQPVGAEASPRPLDLGAWLRDHADSFANHPREADLSIEVSTREDLLVAMPPDLLSQVVDNLIDNAAKYSPAGTPILVKLEVNAGRAELSVADRGAGLGPEDRDRIFEPFYRAEASRRAGHPGVGLGLAIARRIAERCGGTLGVESRPGAGSCFTLRLPTLPSCPEHGTDDCTS